MKTLRIRGNNRQPRILLAARYADFLEIPFHSEREDRSRRIPGSAKPNRAVLRTPCWSKVKRIDTVTQRDLSQRYSRWNWPVIKDTVLE